MNRTVEQKIMHLRNRLDDADMFLGPPATRFDIDTLNSAVLSEFSEVLPRQYLDFLKCFDGLISNGVFIYSSRQHKFPDSDEFSHDFMEINRISRDVDFMKDFLVFGDSDQDEYVLDLSENSFQVRDKQAFDNVYENFESFDELLEHMVNLIIERA
ncbi:YrhA family protein [Pseudomonas sp. NBRC 100443]|uniref:YrhA family protein n=1 Tax=Pseudomonas sp. NBRC 100443 TaxID=1113665 RepID=UPI0024A530A8|nr:YrhA family protein [Pseudomonas sp. NBRC 100443]GLU40019.1 hypothetical protein Pssp01_41120 [Pseudomonas sp. NBRC 100443]